MLSVSLTTIRLFLHVFAATIWVGGQLTLAGLVPGLREISPDAPGKVAQRFARLAWPAYGVLVITGIWNILAVHPTWSNAYGVTLFVKLLVVALAGISAWLHAISRSKLGLAAWGALAGLSSVAALFLGIMLHG
jgi:putative copper export protein